MVRWGYFAAFVAIGAPVLGVTGGCNYTALVRNETSGPVQVRLVQRQGLKRDWTLDSVRVPAGETVRLGPGRSTWGRVLVEAGERTRTEEPAELRVGTGRTSVHIVHGSDGRTLVLQKATQPFDEPTVESR